MSTIKAIITGMNGTVAPALARFLESKGVEIVAWNRDAVPTDDRSAIRSFIKSQGAAWFFHIATGSPDWAAWAAEGCRDEGVRFLFTSSVSVFAGGADEPATVDRSPDATDDYGRYKATCEQRVRSACPDALIARQGWQLGDAPGSNNMMDVLCKQAAEKGQVEASPHGYPGCACLPDTARALYELMSEYPAGTYHLEGNPGLSFYEIVTRIKAMRGASWKVVAADGPRGDDRMADARVKVSPISSRLPVQSAAKD